LIWKNESINSIVLSAKAGDDIILITSKDIHKYSKKGYLISNIDHPISSHTDFVAKFFVYELPEKLVLSEGYEAVVHIHTSQEECVFTRILGKTDKRGDVIDKNAGYIVAGESCIVHITLKTDLAFETFSDSKYLGRFTARGRGMTYGFGTIIKKGPPTRVKKTKKK